MPQLPISSELILALPVANPAGRSSYTFTLASRLSEILYLAQEQFGVRDITFTILGCEFAPSDKPQIWFPGSGKDVIVQLTLECLSDPGRAWYQLAHEAIHLLSPVRTGIATVLEEGLATSFSENYARQLGSNWQSGMESFENAKIKTEFLLKLDRYAIKRLRAEELTISAISKELILRSYPSIPPELAAELTQIFHR